MSFVIPLDEINKSESKGLNYPNSFEDNKMSVMHSTSNQVDAFKLFVILENARFQKLKSLYLNKHVEAPINCRYDDDKPVVGNKFQGIDLPEFPPRYQHLDLPCDWFYSNRNVLSHQILKRVKCEWKSLDRVTKSFLEDVSEVIKGSLTNIIAESHNQNLHRRKLSHITVTPPTSPQLKKPQICPRGFPRLQDIPVPLGGIEEVNMSDEEIITLWKQA
mmetsp:Transcript_25929/g.54625  ORF Transcript_25929/g.54625 Transcript_25929/m.54625 type:complete len:218 (+) Transcript_25929:58-711(+)